MRLQISSFASVRFRAAVVVDVVAGAGVVLFVVAVAGVLQF